MAPNLSQYQPNTKLIPTKKKEARIVEKGRLQPHDTCLKHDS